MAATGIRMTFAGAVTAVLLLVCSPPVTLPMEGATTGTVVRGGQVGDFAHDLEEVLESFDNVVDSVGKTGRIIDPKMNSGYLAVKENEIKKKHAAYLTAREHFHGTPWILTISRNNRQRRMEQAEEEWIQAKASLELEKYFFLRKVAEYTSGFLFFRKHDRWNLARAQYRAYSDVIMGYENSKLQELKFQYQHCWDWMFWRKKHLRRKYEDQQNRCKRLASDLELMNSLKLDDPLMHDLHDLAPYGFTSLENRTDMVPSQAIQRIALDCSGDM